MKIQEVIAITVPGLLHSDGYISNDMKKFVGQLHKEGYITDDEKEHVEQQMNF